MFPRRLLLGSLGNLDRVVSKKPYLPRDTFFSLGWPSPKKRETSLRTAACDRTRKKTRAHARTRVRIAGLETVRVDADLIRYPVAIQVRAVPVLVGYPVAVTVPVGYPVAV
jgi:hypothetical protein